MTAAQFELLSEVEMERLLRTRFQDLVEAGYTWDEAVQIATHIEVDVKRATSLLDRGCPGELALRILI